MRTIKKRHLAILVLSMAVAGAGIGAVYASSDSDGKNNPMSSLVQAIADKFNLDKNEVQEVFDEQRQAMETERQAKMREEFSSRLKNAVADGKLTQAQADLVTTKREELEKVREANKPAAGTQNGQTDEERQARREKMQAEMEELKNWADENGIPQEYLMMMGGMGGHRGHGMGGFGNGPAPESANAVE